MKRWYPDLIRLADCPVEEVRNTDAWVMGQDTSSTGFHEALLKMLQDASPMVRGNAALSLVRFGDATRRPQIVACCNPPKSALPPSGHIVDADRPGTAIHQGGLLAKLATSDSSRASRDSLSDSRTHPLGFTDRAQPCRWLGNSGGRSGNRAGMGGAAGAVSSWTERRSDSVSPYERDLPDISNDVRTSRLWRPKRRSGTRRKVNPRSCHERERYFALNVASCLVVRDYDEAIAFYTQSLGFQLIEDS